MSTFTVKAVSDQTRTWGEDMVSYRVHLVAVDGSIIEKVELSRKNSQPAPTPGEQVTGDVDTSGQYGAKFKAQRIGGGGFNRGGPRPEDPKRAATILRQHSQHMVLQYFALAGKAPSRDQIVEMADWFDADARQAGARA